MKTHLHTSIQGLVKNERKRERQRERKEGRKEGKKEGKKERSDNLPVHNHPVSRGEYAPCAS